jgi:hypothetical protein
MPYVDLYLKMDTSNAYDKSVLKIIKDLPESQRKDFVISALLYYSKSPSYLMDLKVDEMLKTLNDKGNGENDDIEKRIILAVEKTIKSVLKQEMKNIRVSGPAQVINDDPTGESVMADDVFEALANEMVVE